MCIGKSAFFLILMITGITKASKCTTDGEGFKFTITSKRNASRHRIVEVDLERNTLISSEDSGEMYLDVTHGHSVCDMEEVVHLRKSAVALEAPARRSDYELFSGVGYYKFRTTAELWETARTICNSEGAHLIVVNSDAEADVVKEFFYRKPTITGATDPLYVFGGFHDKYTEGTFITVTGEPLAKSGYTKWDGGQPNGGTGSNYGGFSSQALLHDVPNNWKLPFICEQEL